MRNRLIFVLAALVALIVGGAAARSEAAAATQPAGTTQPAGMTLEKAMAAADAYVEANQLGWGKATRAIHMRGSGIEVFYDTPADELKKLGPRTLQVTSGGGVIEPARK